jgi:hypothetical protein
LPVVLREGVVAKKAGKIKTTRKERMKGADYQASGVA